MNVFVLDKDMKKSAEMLDDAHLISQINEACQILMANRNKEIFPGAKIGHINHPVTKFYAKTSARNELLGYLYALLMEYCFRFGKDHQNLMWWFGFKSIGIIDGIVFDYFSDSKTLVDRVMTDDIEVIRWYISTKPHTRPLKWTGRNKPEWWTEE